MMRFSVCVRRTSKLVLATLAATGLAAVIGTWTVDPASARSSRDGKREDFTLSRPAGPAVMAIVSLNQQRVTIYDADGLILRSPVSTGQTGYETPAGIYSVLEKKVEHTSNLYDDASMPFMQRITWSGIALHAGVLPGYPASHGCIRMPLGFAEHLFERTKLGMRVLVVRDDIAPADFVHPALFKPLPGDEEVAVARLPLDGAAETADKAPAGLASASLGAESPSARPRQSLRSIAAAKSAEADAASKKAEETRRAAAKTTSEAARATKVLRKAEGAKARAETQLRQAERMVDAENESATERAQEVKSKALAAVAAAQAQLDALRTDVQPMLDLAARLREEAKAAEAARVSALEEAKEATRKLSPISVFISGKAQRLYVRQARQPLFDSPVTITDLDRPLGTYVFTALAYTNDGAALRWSAVSMYRGPNGPEPGANGKQRRGAHRDAEPAAADMEGARSALDRIAIPKEAIDRIAEVVSPGSTLIVSDEGISTETGNGTDFIILMGGEPQGGIKMRRRNPEARYRYQRPFAPYSWSSGPFWWQ